MWLYNNKMIHAKAIRVNGVQHPKAIFIKWSDAELAEIGIYKITEIGRVFPRSPYYSYSSVEDFTTNAPTITHIATELPLSVVQARMIKDLEKVATDKFNAITGDYTAGEISSWAELEADAIAHQTTPLTSGMLFDEAGYAGITVLALATKVLEKATALKQAKAYYSGTRAKKTLEILDLINVAACIVYEKTFYNYTLTADDVAEYDEGSTVTVEEEVTNPETLEVTIVKVQGIPILGLVIIKSINNITEW